MKYLNIPKFQENLESIGTTNIVFNGQIYEIDTYTSSSTGRTYNLYKQGHHAWKDLQAGYVSGNPANGAGTIGKRGCMITTVAIIMTGYGEKVCPGDLSYQYTTAAEEYENFGFTLKEIEKEDIEQYLKNGYEVHLSLKAPSAYTSSQHKMPLVDINHNKEVFVANTTNRNFGWQPLDKILKEGGIVGAFIVYQ